jgi:hypothetical protein
MMKSWVVFCRFYEKNEEWIEGMFYGLFIWSDFGIEII